jgi:hypothetical protein
MPRYAKVIPFSTDRILTDEDSQRALELGADELVDLAEYALRERPLALQLARQAYVETCLLLYRAIQEAEL